MTWHDKELVFRSNSWELGWFKTPEVVMLTEKIVTEIVNAKWIKTNKILHCDISREHFPFDYQIEEKLIWVDSEGYLNSDWEFLDSKEDYDRLSFELWQYIAKYSNITFKWLIKKY